MTENSNYLHDGEIDLRDIIKTIWENKTIIVLGTVLATLLGIGVNFVLPNVYRASMVLKIGVLEVDQVSKEPVYIDYPENIKAAIVLGSYDSRIKKMLPKEPPKNKKSKLSYIVEIPRKSDVIKVSTDNINKEQATLILAALMQLLKEEYRQKSEVYRSNYQLELETLQSEINQREMEISRRQDYINRTEARIEELSEDLKALVQYGNGLSEEKAIIQSNRNHQIERLIYKEFETTQNLAMMRDLKEIIRNHQISRSDEIEKLPGVESALKTLKSELNQIQTAMTNIQDIETLQAPETSPIIIKPKKTRNIAIAFLAGLFLSIVFVFGKQTFKTEHA